MRPQELKRPKRGLAEGHSLRVCLCAALVVLLAAGSVWPTPVECSQKPALNFESRQPRDKENYYNLANQLETYNKKWSKMGRPR